MPVGVAAGVFIEFDTEVLAPRYRAAEDALALLALAARVVGGRRTGGEGRTGRVIVQTRLPDHAVLQAALRADPGLLAASELPIRTALGLPPAVALAELSGDDATTGEVTARLAGAAGVEVLGPSGGRWLVRAPDHGTLCDALAAAGRPSGSARGRLRIDVDPLRA